MDWNQTYRCAPGFGFRKEAFGGILFHYEGRAPDPRLTFVPSPFLIDLLEQLEQAPLEQVMAEARQAFALDAAQEAAMRAFFAALVERQGLRPSEPSPSDAAEAAGEGSRAAPAQPEATAQVFQQSLRRENLNAPITVTWEVTNRCNLRCVHCLSDSSPEAEVRRELSLAEAMAVADQLVAARVFQVHFGGGEPFVYPGFLDLLRYARGQGMHCLCISTNGALLDRARIAGLEALGGIYLQLSMDGASEATCDALRGSGAFRKVIAALARLQESQIVRTVNLVYCRENAHELDAAHALCARYGATLRVTRLKPSGRGAAAYSRLRPTPAQFAALLAWLRAHPDVLTGDTFFHLNALGGAPLKGFRFCGAARLTCLITPPGDVYPCAFTQQAHFRAGNLREQPFHRIWRDSPLFNGVFRAGEQGACGSCSAYGACGGGCPAVKHALTGRLDLPDPDCVLEAAG